MNYNDNEKIASVINKDGTQELKEMDKLFERLFPICRSITGPGLRESLDILGDYIPLEQFNVKTGTKVFDWVIPPEWHIKEAWLKGPSGEKVCDFKENNLHIVNYSMPVNRKLKFEELKGHLHTHPKLPKAIPYVTSYYKRRWGFCLSQDTLEVLKDGEYHAYIDSEFKDGELNFAHAIVPGESAKEILISSYLCHPSMANNELSGSIVAIFLYNRLKQWKKRRFTYRFVFVPETIGSIAYLHKFGQELKDNLHSGLVLTCLGGRENLSYKQTRRGNTPIDKVIDHLYDDQVIEGSIRSFTPVNGSDERQYCSPGFNLPVGQIARKVYGSYPEYHTSLDDKALMSVEALLRSVNELEIVLQALELEGVYYNRYPYGEVKLDKHGLYPDMNSVTTRGCSANQKVDGRTQLKRILTILNYADGESSLIEIAKKCDCNLFDLKEVLDILKQKHLVVGPFTERQEGFYN